MCSDKIFGLNTEERRFLIPTKKILDTLWVTLSISVARVSSLYLPAKRMMEQERLRVRVTEEQIVVTKYFFNIKQ